MKSENNTIPVLSIIIGILTYFKLIPNRITKTSVDNFGEGSNPLATPLDAPLIKGMNGFIVTVTSGGGTFRYGIGLQTFTVRAT